MPAAVPNNSNARSLNREAARGNIEVVFEATKP